MLGGSPLNEWAQEYFKIAQQEQVKEMEKFITYVKTLGIKIEFAEKEAMLPSTTFSPT